MNRGLREGAVKLRPGHVAPVVAILLVVAFGRLAFGPSAEGPAIRAHAVTAVAPIGVAPARDSAEIAQADAPAAPIDASGGRPIEPAPESFEGPPPAGVTSCGERPRPESSTPGGTWAVIVGINDYPGGGHDLVSSVNDAMDVDRALARFGVPADHRLLLLDGEASSCGLQSGLDWLVERAGPDTTAVFFYAGHARKLGAGSRTLVAADGELLTDVQLGASLSRLRSGRAWIALATCYGGGFTQVLGPNRILTAASDGDSLAYESLDFGRSYLVEYMVRRAMLGDAAPSSVESSFAYARAAIQATQPGRVPVQIDQVPGELDLRQTPQVGQAAPPVGQAPPPSGGGPAVQPPPPPPARVSPTTRPCRPVLLILCSYG